MINVEEVIVVFGSLSRTYHTKSSLLTVKFIKIDSLLKYVLFSGLYNDKEGRPARVTEITKFEAVASPVTVSPVIACVFTWGSIINNKIILNKKINTFFSMN